MPSAKISQLPNIGIIHDSDLMEISQNLGSYFTSSNATFSQITNYLDQYFGYQNGIVTGVDFSGIPLSYTVILPNSYQNLSYTISITAENLRAWSVCQKTTSSFTISSNSSVPLTGNVYWIANKS